MAAVILFGWEMHISFSPLDIVSREGNESNVMELKNSGEENPIKREGKEVNRKECCALSLDRKGRWALNALLHKSKGTQEVGQVWIIFDWKNPDFKSHIEFFQKFKLQDSLRHDSLKKDLFKNTSNQGTEIGGNFTFHQILFCPFELGTVNYLCVDCPKFFSLEKEF